MGPETIKILEKNKDSNFFDMSLSNFFVDMSPKARETKTKIQLLELCQDRKFLASERNNRQN